MIQILICCSTFRAQRAPIASVPPIELMATFLRRGWSPGDFTRLSLPLAAARKGDPIHVVALGGSVTAGQLCAEAEYVFANCSWSARVARMLQTRSPVNNSVTYLSLARGGFDTPAFIPAVHGVLRNVAKNAPPKAHMLIFIDFSVNDAHDLDLAMARMPGQVLPLIMLRSAATEKLVLEIVAAVPDAVPFLVVDPCPRNCSSIATALKPIAARYSIPMLDLAAAATASGTHFFWPDLDSTASVTQKVHPTFEYHQRWAESITWAMDQIEASMPTYSPPTLLAAYDGCSNTSLFEFSAYDDIARFGAHSPCRNTSSSHCELAEDRAGKPGYILIKARKKEAVSEVRFHVNFGAKPTISVTFMRTFNRSDYGDAMLFVSIPRSREKGRRGYLLHGIHKEQTSVAISLTIPAWKNRDHTTKLTTTAALMGLSNLGESGDFGFAVPPNTNGASIIVRLVTGERFKLISLAAC